MKDKSKRIGFTTSLPIEVIYAAGHTPVDLNNLFITGLSNDLIAKAEQNGFPRTICAWIKGIYSAVKQYNIDEVIGVLQGDCSNTHSLMSLLSDADVPIWDFSFPVNKDYDILKKEIFKLERHFSVSHKSVIIMKRRLDDIRKKLVKLDDMTWRDNLVNGAENHFWLVNASDFMGNPDLYEEKLTDFLKLAEKRNPYRGKLRIAYLGVPPIFTNFYQVLENLGGQIVFNEIQRQFAMLNLSNDIVQQYLDYTYPYSVFERIKDIQSEISKRKVDAVISYTQSFCHRQIDNVLLRKYIPVPFLTIEGDSPNELDNRTLLRLESFIEVFQD